MVISCPKCGLAMECPDHLAGAEVACARCGQRMIAPAAAAPNPVPLAMPVEPTRENAPLAAPVNYAKAETLELPPELAMRVPKPPARPEPEPAFTAASATGRDPTTGEMPAQPAARRGIPIKWIAILGGAGLGAASLACLACVLLSFISPGNNKKTGSIVITKVRFANPKEVSPPGPNRLLIYIDRVDFEGPVKATLEDLPPDVRCSELVIPAKGKEGTLVFRVSHGTTPQTANVRLHLESESGAVTDMPITLKIVEEPAKANK